MKILKLSSLIISITTLFLIIFKADDIIVFMLLAISVIFINLLQFIDIK